MLLIDKPTGISSFDVIRRLRRILGVRKMGHAGTLDPRASGLLLVAVGDETKELRKYVGLDKVYDTEVIIGERRSTGDLEGEVVEAKEVSTLSEDAVRTALSGMAGTLSLPVPVFSAVKVEGTPLYRKAREGKKVTPPRKQMVVHRAVLQSTVVREGRAYLHVEWTVGSGTYIRSLAEELGRQIGYPATVGALRRTSVGEYSIADALSLEDEDGIRQAWDGILQRQISNN